VELVISKAVAQAIPDRLLHRLLPEKEEWSWRKHVEINLAPLSAADLDALDRLFAKHAHVHGTAILRRDIAQWRLALSKAGRAKAPRRRSDEGVRGEVTTRKPKSRVRRATRRRRTTWKVFGACEAAKRLAKALGKPVLYLHFPEWKGRVTIEEILKAAPYLRASDDGIMQCAEATGVIVCRSQRQCDALFARTVGDEPARRNRYRGPARVYALTIGADGQSRNENT
jgi:hypothetical protein